MSARNIQWLEGAIKFSNRCNNDSLHIFFNFDCVDVFCANAVYHYYATAVFLSVRLSHVATVSKISQIMAEIKHLDTGSIRHHNNVDSSKSG